MTRHITIWAMAVAVVLTPLVSYASGPLPVPVPEPGTLALLGVSAGAAGVLAWVRGRGKK